MPTMDPSQPLFSIAGASYELQLSVPTVTASVEHLTEPGITHETTGRNYGPRLSVSAATSLRFYTIAPRLG